MLCVLCGFRDSSETTNFAFRKHLKAVNDSSTLWVIGLVRPKKFRVLSPSKVMGFFEKRFFISREWSGKIVTNIFWVILFLLGLTWSFAENLWGEMVEFGIEWMNRWNFNLQRNFEAELQNMIQIRAAALCPDWLCPSWFKSVQQSLETCSDALKHWIKDRLYERRCEAESIRGK
jgi:hypothetical protein